MKEMEIFNIGDELGSCPYQEESHYESDTGYREYECMLDNSKRGCGYGCVEDGCPLSFKYSVED